MHTEIFLVFIIFVLWGQSQQCDNREALGRGWQDSRTPNVYSQNKSILVGISIREFALLSEILYLFNFSSPNSNPVKQYNFQWRICFDWSSGIFLAEDRFFVDFLHHHRNENILIERFQPADVLNPGLCGFPENQNSLTNFDGYLHVPATSSGWVARIHSSIENIMLLNVSFDGLHVNKIYCVDNANNGSIATSIPSSSIQNVVSNRDDICLIPTVVKPPATEDQIDIDTDKNGFVCTPKEKRHPGDTSLTNTFGQLHSRFDTLRTQHTLRSHRCQLWWPWNHSELFLHQPVSPRLSMVRIRTKTILRCDTPQTTSLVSPEDTMPYYLEVVDEFYPTNSSLPSTIRTLYPMYEEETVLSPDTTSTSSSTVFELNTMLHLTSFHPAKTPKVHRMRILSFSGKEVSFFEIHQPVSFGIDDSHYQRNPVPARHIHPMVSQLDTRDDLGFAFHTLFSSSTTTKEINSSHTGKVWVEVGVQTGEFAELMLRTTSHRDISTYVGVDAWRAWSQEEYVDMANVPDREHADEASHHMQCRRRAEARLCGDDLWCTESQEEDPTLHYLCHRNRFLVALPSVQAAGMFQDHSVDVVYLDAMHHYLAVWEDMLVWWPKVKPCGLLAGHDFLLTTIPANNPRSYDTIFTVKPAVQEFARHMGLLLLATQEEAFPSWLLFKPCDDTI